ncbi:MAG: hypothetical protein WBJ21_14775 [Burkholderiaceae bacterium]
MSQQINLLPRAAKPPALSARRLLASLSLLLLCLVAIALWQHRQADQARLEALQTEQHLQAQQALLSALKIKLGKSEAPTDISAKIAALEPQTRVSKALLSRLKNGELGSLDGYVPQLTAIAKLTQPGIWLTAIVISNAGRSLHIEGRALQKEQVLQYARGLNSAMLPFQAQVSDVELAPLLPAQGEKPAAAIFSFKLH